MPVASKNHKEVHQLPDRCKTQRTLPGCSPTPRLPTCHEPGLCARGPGAFPKDPVRITLGEEAPSPREVSQDTLGKKAATYREVSRSHYVKCSSNNT